MNDVLSISYKYLIKHKEAMLEYLRSHARKNLKILTTLTINMHLKLQGTRYKVEELSLTKSKTGNDQTGDQPVYGKVRENLPREPELGYTGIVKRRISHSQGWLDVLV